MWCEVGRSLLSANAQCHHSLNYSPSLGSQMERGGWSGAEQILLKPYMQHPTPMSGFWALSGPC